MSKNKTKRKGIFKIIFGRTAIIALLLVIQIGILILSFKWLAGYMTYIYGGFTLLTAILVIYIINKEGNPTYKLAWMIPILIFPVFGALFYLFVQLQVGTRLINLRLGNNIKKTKKFLKQNKDLMEEIKEDDKKVANLANYMNEYGGYPIYKNTSVKYFPLGEYKFEEIKKQLEKAKRFIFLEYFIVEEGLMWDSILEILERKVKEGVEVRFMYDGTCSLILLPYNYPKKMEKMGIKCKIFSPIKPALSTYQNNRDHRKILVIDGNVAFTGGINLADEYINKKVVYGHWKDIGIMLKGEAVKSLTLMFLQVWNITSKEEEDYGKYISNAREEEAKGYVMPYGDSPVDNENVGELVYMDIINTAKDYVHIMTPYLILDNEMMTSLKYAAKSGVDVKLILPHIPDKWYAYLLARTYYKELIEAGVSIYEYTPGFVHAKAFVSDDEKAVVGTINLDYRSLYLHFECAVFTYKTTLAYDVEKDFQETLKKCEKITIENCKKFSIFKRIIGQILRLFAPLM